MGGGQGRNLKNKNKNNNIKKSPVTDYELSNADNKQQVPLTASTCRSTMKSCSYNPLPTPPHGSILARPLSEPLHLQPLPGSHFPLPPPPAPPPAARFYHPRIGLTDWGSGLTSLTARRAGSWRVLIPFQRRRRPNAVGLVRERRSVGDAGRQPEHACTRSHSKGKLEVRSSVLVVLFLVWFSFSVSSKSDLWLTDSLPPSTTHTHTHTHTHSHSHMHPPPPTHTHTLTHTCTPPPTPPTPHPTHSLSHTHYKKRERKTE